MPIKITRTESGESLRAIREATRAAGRDPDAISTALYVTVNMNQDAAEAEAGLNDYTHTYNELPLTAMTPYQLYYGGAPEDFAAWLGEYAAAGARHFAPRIRRLARPRRGVRPPLRPADRLLRRLRDATAHDRRRRPAPGA